jgi:hypothetical protein
MAKEKDDGNRDKDDLDAEYEKWMKEDTARHNELGDLAKKKGYTVKTTVGRWKNPLANVKPVGGEKPTSNAGGNREENPIGDDEDGAAAETPEN